MKKKLIKTIVYLACFGLAASCVLELYKIHEDRISRNVNVYKTVEHVLQKDSTLLENGRHYGNVNLEMFLELASKKPHTIFEPSRDVRRDGDSITISTKTPSMFFGRNDGVQWRKKYGDNLPISFPDEYSFRAALRTIDGVEYICIPYHILYSLAESDNE